MPSYGAASAILELPRILSVNFAFGVLGLHNMPSTKSRHSSSFLKQLNNPRFQTRLDTLFCPLLSWTIS